MSAVVDFEQVARLPSPNDNVAIATRRLGAGTRIHHDDLEFSLPHEILEGHRFAVAPIPSREPLLSWGLPFGIATRSIRAGEYVCNAKILSALAERHVDFPLPAAANFEDYLARYEFDEASFVPGVQVAPAKVPAFFEGIPRSGRRGVGTRNFVVVMATTSGTAAFVESLVASVRPELENYPKVDGIVPVIHTEGGGGTRPLNLDFVLRTLSGFMVHPNVAAVMAVDYGTEAYTNHDLACFMETHDYPIAEVPHCFFRIENDFGAALEKARSQIVDWLPAANACERRASPVSALKVALQCGGSDAFSGISGNPLAGWVAKEVIRHGGSANLAETDELIGAEPYVLSNVRDADTARTFLEKIEIFKRRVRHHGATAEGNPSGGNNYRGLYNIALKSIGAARKRDPEVRLDHVMDYSAPMSQPGYYFMDSPGNDLESIAGQVASGCNLIFFITGNGSITNFPFVPTLKFVTTTPRFEMLADEMDVNAGRYNDGMAMEALARETFELSLAVASGERSKGEQAGHAQVSVWREWRQDGDGHGSELLITGPAKRFSRKPLPVKGALPIELDFSAYATERGLTTHRTDLIMPTSLCSGQVARLLAEELDAVALVHTEGCGSANAEHLFLDTLCGHLQHRFVRRAVLLEHGCEKTHNDAVRNYLSDSNLPVDHLGWASVQMDGGLQGVSKRVREWFATEAGGETVGQAMGEAVRVSAQTDALRVAFTTTGQVLGGSAHALAWLVRGLVNGGATVVIPSNATMLESATFVEELLPTGAWEATLGYGQFAAIPGFHIMDCPTANAVETLTGLGGSGVELMVAVVDQSPLQSHPMIPLLQIGHSSMNRYAGDLDWVCEPSEMSGEILSEMLLPLVAQTLSGDYRPKLHGRGVRHFQLTRGLLGISM